MARLPRLTLTDMVHHVVWRGNNCQPVFVDVADRQLFLALVAQHAAAHRVQVHAYVLLDNQVHLLLTPTQEGGLARTMQAVGRAYVRRFNHQHGRTGTLWEGRYRSTVVEPSHYLLRCMVYVDTQPVRAGLVHSPEAYPWSSHGNYAGLRHESWLTTPAAVWALGNTPFAREAAYTLLVRAGLSEPERMTMDDAALKGWPLGDAAFLASLAESTDRRLQRGQPGRPRRASAV